MDARSGLELQLGRLCLSLEFIARALQGIAQRLFPVVKPLQSMVQTLSIWRQGSASSGSAETKGANWCRVWDAGSQGGHDGSSWVRLSALPIGMPIRRGAYGSREAVDTGLTRQSPMFVANSLHSLEDRQIFHVIHYGLTEHWRREYLERQQNHDDLQAVTTENKKSAMKHKALARTTCLMIKHDCGDPKEGAVFDHQTRR